MQYGTFLFVEQQKRDMEKERLRIESCPPVSWDEVLNADLNCISNSDDTGTYFEGEIESISRDEDQIVVNCKWVKVFAPVFDEDGDIDRDRMWWRPWHTKTILFSNRAVPRKLQNGKIVILCSSSNTYFTKTILSRVKRFSSL
ncbi:MAG: hypothetical protein HYT62_02135 [Candidatus Yanofskybacteria bacterium]|nr:hypothetical protein [Candidatus Yanofskybacteria bacterium]